MNLHLAEKVIVVTGAAQGIGEAVVEQLALEGAFSVLIDKNQKKAEEVLEKIQARGGYGLVIPADLSRKETCEQAIKQVLSHFGKINGLVNNAGVNDGVGLENGSYESFVESLHKNLIHYYLMAQMALPALKESKGSIVNITSKVAETGQGGTSAYAAANGGRNALIREWAVELAPFGIRVNGVVVAECYTPMYQQWLEGQKGMFEKIAKKIPLENRLTTPEEIANTVVFLLSKRSSHTTGQLIHVDGGYVHLDRRIGI